MLNHERYKLDHISLGTKRVCYDKAMSKLQPNVHVIHPKEILKREEQGANNFNNRLAVKITNIVGSMWSAYCFGLLSLMSLPAILVTLNSNYRHDFPHWIIATSMITLIAWISQNFLQLILLPVIMVGQNVIQGQQGAKAEADHNTLTYLANLQEEQMTLLQSHSKALDLLQKELSGRHESASSKQPAPQEVEV